MIKNKTLLIVSFLLSNFIGVSQENPVFQNIQGKLITYNTKNSPEKTYIQTDKDFYANGETIWYKVYLVDGISHAQTKKSNVVYVELLNALDSIVVQQKLFAKDFGAAGNIILPENIEQGNLTLRAYTKYMLNEKKPFVYTKEIPVWQQQNNNNLTTTENSTQNTTEIIELREQKKPIINFYPEGGNLVSGIHSKLGLKVTDLNGNGIALQGNIVDQNNKIISPFKSYDYGLGQVTFKPALNSTYYASVFINDTIQKYPLPSVLKKGYTISVKNAGEFLTVRLSSTMQSGLKGTFLVGHIRGRTFFKKIQKTDHTKYSTKIMTKDLEDGVAHFTLFTAQGEPVCERLVFIDNPTNNITLSAATNYTQYGQREKVAVELAIKDTQNNPLVANLSASIITNTNNSANADTNIKSWLLLHSDIGKTITNANIFFEDNTMETKNLLDNLMLTHGWRRFIWKEILTDNVNKKLAFTPEKGIMIEGKTTNFKNQYQPKKAIVSFSILDKTHFRENKNTDIQGKFSFGPFNFTDTIAGVIEAKPLQQYTKLKENTLGISIYNPFPKLPALENEKQTKTNTIQYSYPEEYLQQTLKRKIQDFDFDPNVTQLKQVTVVKTKRKKTYKEIVNEKINRFTQYAEPDKRVFADSIRGGTTPNNAFDFLLGVAGVAVGGNSSERSIKIRGGGMSISSLENNGDSNRKNIPITKEPLYLLDNIPVGNTTINTLSPSDVMFIDVLSGPSSAFYGSRGSNGVVAFYTRGSIYIAPEIAPPTPGILDFKINGFTKTREFFSPNYNKQIPEHNKTDYRTTLHWEPNITIEDNPTGKFSFFTGDMLGSYLIKVEGITLDGRPVSTIQTFEVENVN